MGLFQRLLKGTEEVDTDTGKSPGETSAVSLVEEIQALRKELRQEFKLLRESLGEGRSRAHSDRERGGNRRGNRGKRDSEPNQSEPGSFSNRSQRKGLPKEPPEDAPTGMLVDYLRTRKVTIFEGADESNRNEAFEHLARHIGRHFSLVAPFYEQLKRAVASGRVKRVDLESMSEQERSAAVQLGTLLHRHGLIKDFYYHRTPKKQLRVIPTQDGETAQFLTGGWLEMYAVWVLSRRLKAKLSPSRYQVLFNVKGTLPDGKEFEADLMAFVEGRLLWIECKTGNWQDYAARFRGLVKIFGCDRRSSAMLLIRPPDSSTRSRITDMLEMTVISLEETEAFLNVFLGDEEADAPPRAARNGRNAASSSRSSQPTSESRGEDRSRAGRRRNQEADNSSARDERSSTGSEEKLTGVGLGSELEGDGVPRRRRRRRGRRGRGLSRSGGTPESEAAPAAPVEERKPKPVAVAKPAAAEPQAPPPAPESIELSADSPFANARGTASTRSGSKSAMVPKSEANSEESADEASLEAPRRRRRRRRSSASSEAATAVEAHEGDSDTRPEADAKDTSRKEPPTESSEGAGSEVVEEELDSAPRRRRRRRRRSEDAADAVAEEPAKAETEEQAHRSEPAPSVAPTAKPDRGEKADRSGKADRRERVERTEKSERKAKPARKEESERPEPPERELETERDESADKPARASKPSSADKPSRSERPARAEKPARSAKASVEAERKPEPPVKESAAKAAVEKAEKSDYEAKTSHSGVTIAPDLSSMMAGSQSKDSKSE